MADELLTVTCPTHGIGNSICCREAFEDAQDVILDAIEIIFGLEIDSWTAETAIWHFEAAPEDIEELKEFLGVEVKEEDTIDELAARLLARWNLVQY